MPTISTTTARGVWRSVPNSTSGGRLSNPQHFTIVFRYATSDPGNVDGHILEPADEIDLNPTGGEAVWVKTNFSDGRIVWSAS